MFSTHDGCWKVGTSSRPALVCRSCGPFVFRTRFSTWVKAEPVVVVVVVARVYAYA